MFYKRAHYIALGTAAVLTLVLLNLPPGASARLKLALGSVFLPLFGLAGSASSFVDRASWNLVPRKVAIAEIQRLQKENEQLKFAAKEGADAQLENQRLRQQLGWLPKSTWAGRLRPARIVGRDPTLWWRTCTIDIGSRHGVRPKLPVLTSDGLVGQTGQVSDSQTQIILLGDPACGVSVVVQNETRDQGYINGSQTPVLDQSIVTVSFLQVNRRILAGQNVVTSGLGTVFPQGIPVGTILDTKVQDGLFTQARVRLAADLGRLQEVWVMLP